MSAASDTAGGGGAVETDIPARMDRLPFSRFHVLVVTALGITWVLDGLEVTIIGSMGPILQKHETLSLTPQDIGSVAAFYVVGAVSGAVFFGWLTDRFGRRPIFNVTLGIYLVGVITTAFSWNFWSFALFRAITGIGVGREYAAIDSAVDELIPARLRGRIDMIVNGSYWGGAIIGAGASVLLLSGVLVAPSLGWRLAFGIGGSLGLGIIFLRRFVPESPRWLVTHARGEQAEQTTRAIEQRIERSGRKLEPPKDRLKVHPRPRFGFGVILRGMGGKNLPRCALALTLMVAQAFLFNSVFFTYGLVLDKFYHVNPVRTGLYILPLAVGNLLGPLVLGPLFDSVGRKRMVTGTYAVSGVLLAAVALLFGLGLLNDITQTAAWMVIFFFSSTAASSAYLTTSEIFPLETRALALALFYAVGTASGGIVAPWLFGQLIGGGVAWAVAGGYLGAAVLMLIGAAMELRFGISAEGKSLESVATPLSSQG
jgi:MFS family permease